MLGYDRPLKPEWIYKTLKKIEVGTKPSYFYDAYNSIAVELTGKDGRRKTRTVLFRTFIFSFQDNQSKVENNILIELSKQNNLEHMIPLYITQFTLHYNLFDYFTKLFFQIFDSSQTISSKAITSKMVEKFGDVEIVKRSTRAFLKTITDFNFVEKINQDTYHQLPKQELSEQQVIDIMYLFSECKNTKQINLKSFGIPLFAWYKAPDLDRIANKYHPAKWEYIKGVDRSFLMLK